MRAKRAAQQKFIGFFFLGAKKANKKKHRFRCPFRNWWEYTAPLEPISSREAADAHARSAWWLESFSYAPRTCQRASAALADSRGQTQKLPSISLHGSSPDPSAERRKEERKFLVCVAEKKLPKRATDEAHLLRIL